MIHEAIKVLLSQMIQLLLSLDDPIDRESSIYAIICILKEECGEHFENALIYYLKEGSKI